MVKKDKKSIDDVFDLLDKKLGDSNDINDIQRLTAAAMTIGVLAGVESVLGNVNVDRKNSEKDVLDMLKNPSKRQSTALKIFHGDPLNILACISHKGLRKYFDMIRAERLTSICRNNEEIKPQVEKMLKYALTKLDVPSTCIAEQDIDFSDKEHPRTKGSKKDFGDLLKKHWDNMSDTNDEKPE